MRRLLVAAFWLIPLTAQSPKKNESVWDKLLRIAGVSATPAALRGEEQVAAGDVWLVTVAPNPVPQRVTRGRYRSPVFDSQGTSILALQNGELYRIPVGGDTPIKLYSLNGVSKLVGVSRDEPDQLLVLAQENGRVPGAAMVSIATGTLQRIPHNLDSTEDQVMLAHLAGWERVYGDTRLYMEKNEKEGPGGVTTEFTDIYLKRGSEPPMNLTNGSNISSSQPSLSADGRRVVLIRAGR